MACPQAALGNSRYSPPLRAGRPLCQGPWDGSLSIYPTSTHPLQGCTKSLGTPGANTEGMGAPCNTWWLPPSIYPDFWKQTKHLVTWGLCLLFLGALGSLRIAFGCICAPSTSPSSLGEEAGVFCLPQGQEAESWLQYGFEGLWALGLPTCSPGS